MKIEVDTIANITIEKYSDGKILLAQTTNNGYNSSYASILIESKDINKLISILQEAVSVDKIDILDNKLKDLAKTFIGEMRDLSEDEQERYNDYLKSIFTPTGKQLFIKENNNGN